MKKTTFFIHFLTLLLVTMGFIGCFGGRIDHVPDQTRPKSAATQTNKPELDESNDLSPVLDEQWIKHLNLLQGKQKQHDKVQDSILNLREEARLDMLEIVNAVCDRSDRKKFLEALSSFTEKKLAELLNTLLYVYAENSELMLEGIRARGNVKFHKKIKFGSLLKKLPKTDEELFYRLMTKLKTLS